MQKVYFLIYFLLYTYNKKATQCKKCKKYHTTLVPYDIVFNCNLSYCTTVDFYIFLMYNYFGLLDIKLRTYFPFLFYSRTQFRGSGFLLKKHLTTT